MSTEFKVVVEGELSDGTAEAVSAAIQKAALLELAGSADLEEPEFLSFRPNIRGGRFLIDRDPKLGS